MNIIKKKISELTKASYNPRKIEPHMLDRLVKSIEEFDIVEPIIWNEQTGNIVGGHQRLKALEKLGREETEVVVVNLTESKEKALNIALNKISGEWDFPKLKDLIIEIDTGEFPIELTGFDYEELSELIDYHKEVEGLEQDEEAVPALMAEPTTVLGDQWVLGRHRLFCGDSLRIAQIETLLDGESADMVYTDPPYGISIVPKNGMVGGKTKKVYSPIIGDDSSLTATEAYSLCAYLQIPKMIFWGGNHYASFLPNSSCWIVWDKQAGKQIDFADCELAWTNFKSPARIFTHIWDGFRRDSEKGEDRIHPTQKPVALAEWCLTQYGEDCDLILDLFGGSGSTLIACEKLKKRCYLMELDPRYCDQIVQRWEKFTGEKGKLVKG